MAETSVLPASMSFSKRWFPFGFRDEALVLIKITVPFAMGNVLASWLISFVSLAFVGHARGQLELNACALGLSIYVLVANSLMLGLNFGCDTLLPQCFGGNKRKMGLTVQRAVIITGYSCLISWTLILNAVNK
jgi:Na+-driven multidrug efflux pump